MSQNANEIVVAASGAIHVAPYGTALPADSTAALDAAFTDLGYVTTDGVTFTATPSVTDINSWQKATPTRRIVTARALTAAWSGQQWNMETFAVAFGGGKWTPIAGGQFRYDPPSDTDPLVDFSLVIDATDGNEHHRWVVRRGNVNNAVTTSLTRGAAALLPVTFDALAPDDAPNSWFFMTDSVEMSWAS